MITKLITDNTIENFIVFDITKQQIGALPKEESQMFQDKTSDWITSGDEENESENSDIPAFSNPSLNSSHTPTDYIGALNIKVPYKILDDFADFKLINPSNVISNLFDSTDIVKKVTMIQNGVGNLRIPKNKFNTILTVQSEIENNGSDLIKNYGDYYILISPKYIEATITNIIHKKHIVRTSVSSNNNSGIPFFKRRDIYECNKTSFIDTIWNFLGPQQGRLYGSVVEIWDSNNTELKQIKIMTENNFNFSNNSAPQFVLYPNNMGYDAPTQKIAVGDVIRIFPRETYFDSVLIKIEYKDEYSEINNLVSFMINDVVRDVKTGVYEIYDDKGVNIDSTSGNFLGNVLHRYQISATDRYEIRKRIKK